MAAKINWGFEDHGHIQFLIQLIQLVHQGSEKLIEVLDTMASSTETDGDDYQKILSELQAVLVNVWKTNTHLYTTEKLCLNI